MKKQKIKTIEARIWKLCKEIIRASYLHVCVCCLKPIEGKDLHTGHMFRKKFLPVKMKYDLRILRPQCNFCNRRKAGNLEWYFSNILRVHNKKYITNIADDILYYKNFPMNTHDTREYLLDLEHNYATILKSYQRMAEPVY